MPLTPFKVPARTDYVEAVYRILVDAITDGSMGPNERITQEEIAARLDVSRTPVLQALKLLKKDGFVSDAPGRGVRVAPLEPDKIGSLYQIRGALDGLAARLAAQSGIIIDPQLIAKGRRAAKGTNLKAAIDADLAFHNAVYAASGNTLIAESAHQHWVHLRRVMGAVHRTSTQRSTIWDEHEAIASAIASGDVKRAVLLTELHIQRASNNVIQRLGKLLVEDASVATARRG